MKRYLICCLISCILLVQCSERKPVGFDSLEILPSDVKERTTALEATKVIDADEIISAKQLFVYKDSVLVVVNKPKHDGWFLGLYNLYTKSLLGRFVRNGNGPKEMLNVMAHVNKNKLILHDFVKRQIVSFDLDSAILDKAYSYGTPVSFCKNAGSPFVTFFDKSRLIMLNPYYLENDKLGISNGEPRFLVNDIGSQAVLLRSGGRKPRSYNIEQGFIIPDKSHNKVIYASCFYPEIEMYDYELKPLKKITGPDDLKIDYSVSGNDVVFSKVVPYAYQSYAMVSDGFYLLYIGGYYTARTKYKDMQSWIFKFDWDGNYIKSYHFDQYLESLSVTSDEETFYGQGFDENGNVTLWKLSKKNET